jgi:uncharacterized protein
MSVEISTIESLMRVSWRSRPASFVALMSLYESNYLRAGWLLGDVRGQQGRQVSRIESDCDLVLTIVDQTPYTTTINLTYGFADSVPDMGIRLYHDARLAEVLSWAGHHEHEMLKFWRARMERELDQRWARNMMLNKWLEYCVDRGHRFASGFHNNP